MFCGQRAFCKRFSYHHESQQIHLHPGDLDGERVYKTQGRIERRTEPRRDDIGDRGGSAAEYGDNIVAANSYSCSFSSATGKLTISNTTASPADFSIWPADYLKHGLWNPLNLGSIPAYIEGDDCFDVIGFASPYKITGNSTTPITGEGHISVMPYHTLFLHSDLGLQGDALGPDNSSSIVRKIVLETGPGTQVNDFHSLPYDFVSVQPSQIRNLHFRLADYRGRTVDMLHTGLSFSLLFVPEDEF
jgi:hypothetical protein